MKLKRIMAIVLCFAMVLSTMSFNVFAATNYLTAADIFPEADADGVITLVEDITLPEDTRFSEELKIDLNGHTLKLTTSVTFNGNATLYNGTIDANDVSCSDGIIRADYHHSGEPAITLKLEDVTVEANNVKYGTGLFYVEDENDTLILTDVDVETSGANEGPGSGVFYSASSFSRGKVILEEGTTVTSDKSKAIFFATDVELDGASIECSNVSRPVFRQAAGTVTDSTINVNSISDGQALVADEAGNNFGVVNFVNSTVTAPAGTPAVNFSNEGSAAKADSTSSVGDNQGVVKDDDTTGEGDSEEDIILINTAEELTALRDAVNNGDNYAGKYVKLNADIDLSSVDNWTPIGDTTYNSSYAPVDPSVVFSGTFDGNDKVISNLKIEKTLGEGPDADANVGLFGIIGEGAVIKNLTITNVDINTDGRNVGALAGVAHKATLDNITVNGNIKISGGNNTCGVCAMTRYYDVSATNITVSGEEGSYINGKNIVAGMFAEIAPNGSNQTFENLSVENVEINGVGGVGGVVGLLTDGSISGVSVKDVELVGKTEYQGDAMGRIRLGSIVGLLGSGANSSSTVSNIITVENVTAKNLDGDNVVLPVVGANYGGSVGNATEARIGDKYFPRFTGAVKAAKTGDTITLLCDVNAVVDIPDGVTLNTNGYKCIQAKGTWGGIDWTLDAEGTLTIAPTEGTPIADANSGKTYEVGAWREAVRYDSTGEGKAIEGWPYDRTKVKKLIIEEGVTSIGSFTAQGFTNLTGEVVIPSTVTYIGQEAFQKSTFTKLIFAEGGTEELCIAQGAFKNLIIEEVSLPSDRPVHLHAWVFNNCLNLKSATLPATLVSVHGTNHIDYFKDFNAHSNPTWTQSSDIFAYNKNMETITFGSEEVKNMFFAAQGNQNSIDSIGDVEIKVVVPAVAKIGDKGFDTLAKAIEAAQANDIITLVDNVTEDVTINQNITLDGNGKTYTGTMTLSSAITATIENVNFINGWITKDTKSAKGNYTIKNCTFDGEDARDYSLRFKGAASITVENCDVKDNKFSFLYVSAGTNIVSVKDVTVDGCANYGIYFASGVNDATIEGLTVKNSIAGLVINNEANRALTLKDCTFENVEAAVKHSKATHTITTTLLGDNNFGTAASDEYAKFVLAEGAELTAANVFDVTTNIEGNFAKYADGKYKSVKAVAQIGEAKYDSLAEAFAVGGDIVLLADVELAKTITVKNDASLDLNGYTLSGTCNAGQSHLFMVNNGAKLTIKDNSSEQTGIITYAGNESTGWIVDVEGKLVLESGTLELTGTWDIGYAVDVRPNAWGTAYTEGTAFVMNGGKIVSSDGAVRVASSSADTYKDVSASFTMNGGEIEAAWDGVFVQQSNPAWDVLNVTINNGTIKSALNPVRFYGPVATSYVNGEDCVDIALNGGTLSYTGTEAREWLVDGILRLGGGVTASDFMKDCDVTASAAFATTNVADGYSWVSIGRKYRLQTLGEYSFVVDSSVDEIIDSGDFTVYVKVSSEKVDNFHSSEYIVTYDSNLLTCAEDNGSKDFDSATGTLRLQCLEGANVNEVIDTLHFTTKDFYLTQETEIKVSGIVCATQYDAATGTSEPVSDGAVVILLKDSFNVTVGAGLEGASVAYNKTDYVVSIAAENQGKQNTIKYTINDANGNPVENTIILPAGTNEYTISGDDIIGDMTFEISDAYSIEIITDYVTGYALILVDGSADGYTYNGHQMLKINRDSGSFEYNGRYGWLVDGSAPGTTLESVEAAAYAAIRAGEESKAVETGYDVNSYINGDGKINFYDVSAAYACQKIDFALSDVDDYFYMELYLASDANCDGKVDSSDSAIISVNYNN